MGTPKGFLPQDRGEAEGSDTQVASRLRSQDEPSKGPLLVFPFLYAVGGGLIATAIYLAARAWQHLTSRAAPRMAWDPIPLPFIVVAVASALGSEHPRLAWGSVAVVGIMAVTYWLLLGDMKDGCDSDDLLHYWVLGAMALSILAVNGFLENRSFAASAWIGKNGMGTLLATSLPLVQLYAARGHHRALGQLLVTLVFVGLALTMSLGAWLGAAAGQGLLLVANRRWRRTVLRLALAFALVMAVVGAYAQYSRAPAWDLLITRLDPTSSSKTERILIWRASLAMWRDHPWFGVGLGTFSAVYPGYRLPEASEPVVSFAHNLILNTMAETGILGLGTLAFMLGAWLLRAARAVRASPDPGMPLAVLAAYVALLVHQLFDGTAWSMQTGMGLWLLGAWMSRLGRMEKEASLPEPLVRLGSGIGVHT